TCLVEGNYIGTDVSGTRALGDFNGIFMEFASGTEIGGPMAGDGNLISANRGSGVFAFFGANNVIQGNKIGTDASGTIALGNGGGIALSTEDNDIIGGAMAAAGNLISANQGDAVDLLNRTTGTLVQGNTIGTEITGTMALGNAGNGVLMAAGVNGTI